MALSYFDCNVCVGQRGLKLRQENGNPRTFWNAWTAPALPLRSFRVYPYLLIDPAYVSDVAGTAYHYYVEERFPAMKMFFDRTRVRYNDPIFEPWWKIADENHLFGLMDPGSYPQYLADVEEMAAHP